MAPKAKKEKMSLGTFLTNESYGSWADEMEDMPIPSASASRGGDGDRRAFSYAGGMGGSSFDRPAYSVREELPLPSKPPFTAHIGNMAFDATSADLEEFFKDCAVTNVRIVEDKLDHKPKGFAYVEYGTLDGLKKALSYSDSSLGGRRIRVSVAEPPKDRESTRDFSDWSRKGPLPDLPGQQQRRASDRAAFGGNRFDSGASDAGSDRAPSRRGGFESDGKPRDFGNWERRGPLSPIPPTTATSLREGGRQKSRDSPVLRHNSPAWGEGRSGEAGSQEGSRPPRREFQERPQVQREPTAAERDTQWRTNMRPDAQTKSPTPTQSRETSNPPSPAAHQAPTSRPKLNLQKRTVSEAVPASPLPESSDSKASPFGAARPIDTTAREKEIEEKRQMAIRQKKDADEKAKAEKVEEKRLAREAKDKATAEKMANARNAAPNGNKGEDLEKGETSEDRPNAEILSRATGEGATSENPDDEEEEEADDGIAAASVSIDEKDVKPKTVVRDAPGTKANGSWRDSPKADAKNNETAENLEEEGWSTIPTKQRNTRRNQGQRAIAS